MVTETGLCTRPLETVTAKELLNTEFEPLRPIISRILPSGTFVYAGASKIGKSWMVLWLANQVSLGLPVWEFETHPCEVLYLSLEDTKRRLQQRLNEIADVVGNVHFATKAGLLGNGFEEQLVDFIRQYPAAKLIIIDTLQKVRNKDKDKHGYSDDYDVVGKIKEIGDTHNVTFLIVHHTRKEGDDDAVNTISGTNGIAGSADGIFILQKENRLQNRANLLVVGRDVQTITLSLDFDPESCKWSLLSHSDNDVTTATDPVLLAINCMVNEHCHYWEGTATELLTQLKAISGEVELKANALTRKLNSNSDLLLTKFGIAHTNKRVGAAKHIVLKYRLCDTYDKTDILDTTHTPPNIDNTAHIVHANVAKELEIMPVPPLLNTGKP